MTEYDNNNLMFLMNLDSTGIALWYAQADEDDRNYAESLLVAALQLVNEHSIAVAIEDTLEHMESFPDAQKVLDKFVK
jgi:hypothetical protein